MSPTDTLPLSGGLTGGPSNEALLIPSETLPFPHSQSSPIRFHGDESSKSRRLPTGPPPPPIRRKLAPILGPGDGGSPKAEPIRNVHEALASPSGESQEALGMVQKLQTAAKKMEQGQRTYLAGFPFPPGWELPLPTLDHLGTHL